MISMAGSDGVERMKTSSAKAKGRKLQQFTAQLIQKIFNLKDGDVESQPMGSAGVDIRMAAIARDVLPISIECKNMKSFPSLTALTQSRANKFPDTIPAVVWKPFGKGMEESIIYFNLEEFLNWYKENTQ